MNVIKINPSYLIINKPSGLVVHQTDERDTQPSVVSWLLEHYPDVQDVGEDQLRPGIVHRLDKETSGVMVIARTQAMFKHLKKQFQERQVQKVYLALVHGLMPTRIHHNTIDAPLGKIGTKQTTKLTGKRTLTPREAITDYDVEVGYVTPDEHGQTYTLLEVRPRTGRTHQIRVHLNHINYPIVCDPLYGGKKKICPPELGRLFLHAHKLEFVDLQGHKQAFEAPLAPELQDYLDILDKS